MVEVAREQFRVVRRHGETVTLIAQIPDRGRDQGGTLSDESDERKIMSPARGEPVVFFLTDRHGLAGFVNKQCALFSLVVARVNLEKKRFEARCLKTVFR